MNDDLWVTKTQLKNFMVCPYAFWLVYSGKIKPEEAVSDFQHKLAEIGIEFEKSVLEGKELVEVDTKMLPELFRQDTTLYEIPAMENTKLKVRGKLDGIKTEFGALCPIEIKSHKTLKSTDKIELAFYWMLLSPYRTKKKATPKGYVELKSGDVETVTEEVILTQEIFDNLEDPLGRIREAMVKGVEPSVCSCYVCKTFTSDEDKKALRDRKDLTLIKGIGLPYKEALEKIGVKNYDDLLKWDSAVLVEKMRQYKVGAGIKTVETWKFHAQAYKRNKPVIFGDEKIDFKDMICIDFETTLFDQIPYLIGLCLCKKGKRHYDFFFALNDRSEKKELLEIIKLLKKNKNLKIVTWSGNTAEMVVLKREFIRLKIPLKELELIKSRHFDGYRFVENNMRFPTPKFNMKELCAFFGTVRNCRIKDAQESLARLEEYRTAKGKKKEELKNMLIEYNKDDLDYTIDIIERIGSLISM